MTVLLSNDGHFIDDYFTLLVNFHVSYRWRERELNMDGVSSMKLIDRLKYLLSKVTQKAHYPFEKLHLISLDIAF